MPQDWSTVAYPLPLDAHTRRPTVEPDEDPGCRKHGTRACAPCTLPHLEGALWEAPDREGQTVKVTAPYSAGIVTGPKRPAVTFRPLGHDCTGTVTVPRPPEPDYGPGPWRTRTHKRATVKQARPQAPSRNEAARQANRELAERLGIKLPE